MALNDLHEAKKTVNSMDQKLKGLNDEKAAQEAKLNELQKINMEKANRVQAMELEHKNVEEALRLKTEEYDSKMAELTKMEFEIETMESESKNIDLRSNGINYDFERETFYKYLELKGNIRVFCRVKPVSQEDLKKEYQSALKNKENMPPNYQRGSVLPRGSVMPPRSTIGSNKLGALKGASK